MSLSLDEFRKVNDALKPFFDETNMAYSQAGNIDGVGKGGHGFIFHPRTELSETQIATIQAAAKKAIGRELSTENGEFSVRKSIFMDNQNIAAQAERV